MAVAQASDPELTSSTSGDSDTSSIPSNRSSLHKSDQDSDPKHPKDDNNNKESSSEETDPKNEDSPDGIVNEPPTRLPDNLMSLPEKTPGGKAPTKRYYIANELYVTEREYIESLKLIGEDFEKAIEKVAPSYFMKVFFKPVHGIMPVNQMLMEKLKTRIMEDWDENPKISDIMINIGPYLKEYSIFAAEIDTMNYLLEEVIEKFEAFAMAYRKFERSPRLKKLPFRSFLLHPINRLGKYPLLLQNYLKTMKEDEEDYETMKKAYEVISGVVEHVNEQRRAEEKARELRRLKDRIYMEDNDELMKPGRELIKHGKLDKWSRREPQERYFVLFNDSLYYMKPVMNGVINFRASFPLEDVEIKPSTQSTNEFTIESTKRSFALIAESPEERDEWITALENAKIEDEEKRESFEQAKHKIALNTYAVDEDTKSIQSNDSHSTMTSTLSRRDSNLAPALGERAPCWVNDNWVTMCQICMKGFSLVTRRHHCRACGNVVCGSCSDKKFPLKYADNAPERVCINCYECLSSSKAAETPLPVDGEKPPVFESSFDNDRSHEQNNFVRNTLRTSGIRGSKRNIPNVFTEVTANEQNCLIKGRISKLYKRTWKSYWCVVKGQVLYFYNASHDMRAVETLPLLGYHVCGPSQLSVSTERIIQLVHPKETICFQVEQKENYEKWFEAFQKSSKIE